MVCCEKTINVIQMEKRSGSKITKAAIVEVNKKIIITTSIAQVKIIYFKGNIIRETFAFACPLKF